MNSLHASLKKTKEKKIMTVNSQITYPNIKIVIHNLQSLAFKFVGLEAMCKDLTIKKSSPAKIKHNEAPQEIQ